MILKTTYKHKFYLAGNFQNWQKISVFLFVFILYSLTTVAQQFADANYYLLDSLNLKEISEKDRKLIDSCLSVYHSDSHDTIRMGAINSLVEECWNDNVWPRYNELLLKEVQKKLSDTVRISMDEKVKYSFMSSYAVSLSNMGYYIQNYEGNLTKALSYYENSLKIQKTINDKQNQSASLNNIGYVYHLNGETEKALECYLECIEIQKEIKDNKGLAASYNNIGFVFRDWGQIEKAIEYYHRSLKLNEKAEDNIAVALCLTNIGGLYKLKNELDKALEFQKRALEIQKELGNAKETSRSLNNIGELYGQKGFRAEALAYLGKALKIRMDIGDKIGEARTLHSIGSMYGDARQFEKAMSYLNKALSIRTADNNMKGVCETLLKIGVVSSQRGKHNQAESSIKKSLKVAQKLSYPELIKASAKALSDIYQKQNNGKEALVMYKLYIQMRDSINNTKTEKAMLRQQAKYEYEKQKELDDIEHDRLLAIEKEETAEQELALQRKKNGITTRNYLLVIVVILALAIWFYWSRVKTVNKYKLNLIRQESLKSQVRPHFIFNVMNSIQTLILKDDSEGATIYLSDFSSLMRKNLEAFSENWISFKDEMELTTLYLKLEKLRFKDKLNYTIEIDESIEMNQIQVPPMFIQPLVENAIIHGIMPSEFPGKVELSIKRNAENQLELNIIDNGVGYEPSKDKDETHKSVGLSLTRERLKLWNAKNELKIQNLKSEEKQGSEINITINLS